MTGADYAKALFELSGEQEEQNIIAAEQILREHPDYRRMLDCGMLSAKETDALISEAFGDSVTSGVLKMMARKRQLYLWEDFVIQMGVLLDQHRNVLRAKVVTARPLSEQLKEKLARALSQKTGKTVMLEITEDPTVLGGISIQAEGLFWDGTLREQLRQMSTVLKGELE